MLEELFNLPQQSAVQQPGLQPGFNELLQSAALGGVQQTDPAVDHARQKIMQSPQDALKSMWEQYYAVQPGEKPTKGKKIKKGIVEVLGALLGGGYEAPSTRFEKRVKETYPMETQRLSLAPALDRVNAQREIAEAKEAYNQSLLAERERHAKETEANSRSRIANTAEYNQGKLQGLFQNLGLKQRGLEQQAPLVQARTNLTNTQATNAAASEGLPGIFGAGLAISKKPQDTRDVIYDTFTKTRDAATHKPQAGGGSLGNRLLITPTAELDLDTGEIKQENALNLVSTRTGTKTPLDPIKLPPGNLNTKEQAAVTAYGQSSALARDLTHSIASAINSGNANDFMGILQGNQLFAEARASGLFNKHKTFPEALFQGLKVSSLFNQLNSATGKQINQTEMKLVTSATGTQSNSPDSLLNAAIAPALLLEVAQLRAAKKLPLTVNTVPIVTQEANRFISDVLAGRKSELRSMRELLSQNGLLRNNINNDAPPDPKDQNTLDILKKIREERAKRNQKK